VSWTVSCRRGRCGRVHLPADALFLLTKTSDEMTTRKRQRNLVYTVCGVVMAVGW
jgi:hypothetical protein